MQCLGFEGLVCSTVNVLFGRNLPVLLLRGFCAYGVASGGALQCSHRTQYPLIKEYTLNHNIRAPIVLGIILK